MCHCLAFFVIYLQRGENKQWKLEMHLWGFTGFMVQQFTPMWPGSSTLREMLCYKDEVEMKSCVIISFVANRSIIGDELLTKVIYDLSVGI